MCIRDRASLAAGCRLSVALAAAYISPWSGMSGMTNYHFGRTAKTTEEMMDKMAQKTRFSVVALIAESAE